MSKKDWYQIEKPVIKITPPGPKAKKIIDIDLRIASPALTRTSDLVPEESHDVWVKDVDGNIYMDLGSGIAVTNLGHNHPKVVETLKSFAGKLDHINSNDYYSVQMVEYFEMLMQTIPGIWPKRGFLSNSGAEAVECGLKIAKWHSNRPYTVGFIGAFHGRTMGALSFTTTSVSPRRRYFPMMPGAIHTPYAYCYRCVFKQKYPECGMTCIDYLENTLMKKVAPPEEVGAILFECIQGAGGYIVPPDDFLKELRRIASKYNILLIDDEVQTGMGRTGKMWAIQHTDVEPEILCAAKGIAAGLPMGATIAKAEVMDWSPGSHENTMGGNPLITEVAKTTLNVLKEEKLLENAIKQGTYLKKRLEEVQNRQEIIGDIRGKGLMVGVELVKDRKSKEPASGARDKLIEEAFKRGILLLGAGASSLRLAPPLTITKNYVDVAVDIFEESLKKVRQS